jgi:succinate-semialdehyde dehydrogenase / glutarate-semialdehyde dehydrogenase
MKLISINPSNGRVVGELEISTLDEIKTAVAKAQQNKKRWKDTPLDERISNLKKVFEELTENKQKLAELQAIEMGMPISIALDDVDDSIKYANWYFDNAANYLSVETIHEDENEIHQVIKEPLGVAATILPWNFPLANVVWGALQGMVAGNVTVMKHSEECPFTAQYIASIFSKHLPDGVFAIIYGTGEQGKQLVEQDIDFIQFTGSTRTGQQLYKQAGGKFIKANLEMGGSAPGLIFEDADLEVALPSVCSQRLFHAGQCCDGLKRLIVHESLVEEVVQRLKRLFEAQVMGDAMDPKTEIGPLVAKRQLELLEAQVEDAVDKGAEVVTGGESLEKQLGGYFYKPTILTAIDRNMRVWQEEVFGPVLPIVTFKNYDQAIILANDTQFGLGAYAYTNDEERMNRLARDLESGMVSFNGVSYLKPSNPFGGYKMSGLGREHGKYGFHEVTQVKVVAKRK